MTLRLEIDGPLANLLIDRADKRNAFDMAMWEALPGLLDEAAANRDLRLLVVRAAEPGGAFCAGADIRELLANKDDADWRAANQKAINRAQYELARHPLPTLAFVEGDCIGGGCGIALACDLRLATDRARFGITPAKLGLVYPLHDVKLLTDLVGPGQARRILYTGALLDAEEALRIGLIEVMAETPDGLIEQLLAASPHSIRETKRFVRRVLDGQAEDDADTLAIFAEAFSGADFIEGTSAFVEKRKPEF
ncbi:enoyl-CoA hydratase/isomerase family protein [Erythrobacter sp. HL-111]|uniref:enoyl-CoA hydratase/isomerase family protein n=1 Tax=Erythrobacter sp. HL-111 TaxID=1798193 RepID=UPI0006DA1B24|nr:enoyl-CoA hydratase-related protein [Erythrobacter sp. HL-111]KPP94909.1 MAG: Enoyl-CoA hydratase/carnithine racemase [Erythrobacteraceae bacterium HL-111]SDS90826.1 Enoyl-CoA hydratase/carnithine racemase [Erythrobacter sp. HL-111]